VGKLIYLMNVSLDGFVETPDHSLSWTKVDEEIRGWFNEQARSTEATLHGRRMYEQMAAYGQPPRRAYIMPSGSDGPSTTDRPGLSTARPQGV
jgi:dihydrofolate reductase